jgi:sugar phosphate isomerase/epimerase
MNGDTPEVDAKAARAMLDGHGLICCATHAPFEALRDNTEREAENLKTLGCNYVAIGGIWPKDYEAFARFADESRPVVEALKAYGIRFGYHNHAHEFVRRPGIHPRSYGAGEGTYYELLIEMGGPDLMLEIDTYWVNHAGVDPVKLLRRCAGRVPVIHVKDKQVVAGVGPDFAPVGEGNLDWTSIVGAGTEAGVEWYVVEQDTCLRDPFDCLKSSFEFLDPMLA